MALIQITAYVRNDEDLAKWKALGNKTEWLHEHLNPIDTINKRLNAQMDKLVDNGLVQLKKIQLCEHYQPKGSCLVKGCKNG